MQACIAGENHYAGLSNFYLASASWKECTLLPTSTRRKYRPEAIKWPLESRPSDSCVRDGHFLRRTDEFSARSPGRRPSAPTQRRLLSLPRHTQRLDAGLPPSTRRPQTTDKAAYPGDPYSSADQRQLPGVSLLAGLQDQQIGS